MLVRPSFYFSLDYRPDLPVVPPVGLPFSFCRRIPFDGTVDMRSVLTVHLLAPDSPALEFANQALIGSPFLVYVEANLPLSSTS